MRRGCPPASPPSLATGRDPGPPPLAEQGAVALSHLEAMLEAEGPRVGLRNARKHIGWYLAATGRPAPTVREWRRRLCTSDDADFVRAGLAAFYVEAMQGLQAMEAA